VPQAESLLGGEGMKLVYFQVLFVGKENIICLFKIKKNTQEHNIVIASFARGLFVLNFFNSMRYEVTD